MGDAPSHQRMGNLPVDVTSFVGRRREVADIKRLLSSTRLVTLTGAGGVGKTRLALRVAGEIRKAFPDAVWLAELDHVTDPALVAYAVSEALGITDHTSRSQLTVLADHLRDRELLLVLDNCEHLVETSAALARQLLAAAGGLRILATSRQALRVAGEQIWWVPPLPLPPLDGPATGCPPATARPATARPATARPATARPATARPAAAPEPHRGPPAQRGGAGQPSAAMALFAERAAAVDSRFTITPANHDAVARLCHRLDGIPLAIELAAARLRVLPLTDILDRLDDRFRLLTAGNRAALPRQQTLRAAVDWSYDLCSYPEQLLWARASVFSGGFDLAAAQAVCGGDGLPPEALADAVRGLVERSVLYREAVPEHSAQVRYHLMETLREYGRTKLREHGEETMLRQRHRDWCVGLAERGERDWFSPRQAETFARTGREHANLRAALEFCLGSGGSADGGADGGADARAGQYLAATLWFYWVGCGFLAEGRYWLDRAIASGDAPTQQRRKALWVGGYVAILQGDTAAAVTVLRECRVQAQRMCDPVAQAYAIHRLGCAALVNDDHPAAEAFLTDAIARYEALGELNSNVLMARIELAMTAAFQGDLAHAEELCRQARAVCEKHGEQWALAYALYVLAFAEWSRGNVRAAVAHARESLRINHTFRDLVGIVLPMELLALFATADGVGRRSAALLGAAHRIWPSVGLRLFGSAHFNKAHVLCERLARDLLGAKAYDDAFRRGAELDLDRAVAYALGEAPAASGAQEPAPDTPLTRREHQVAELIGRGMSNKRISAELVISQRTAEAHVEHILAKLGFSSRLQVAEWIRARG